MSVKTRKMWDRDEIRLGALLVALTAFGMAIPTAIIWGALMIWHRDFKRRFDNWYMGCTLAGLVATVLFAYPLSTALRVPPSWIAVPLVAGGIYVGLRGRF